MNQRNRVTVGAALFLSTLFAVGAICAAAQAGKPEPVPATVPAPVAATAEQQAKIDSAWKDVQIANLRLQLMVEQVVSEMEKGTYYDYNQQRFFRRVPAPAKPAPAPPPAPPPAPAKK
jgi:PBP1b-binding outer membrane lipoprotein LpoB